LLFAAGQGGTAPAQTSHIGKLNTTTMKFQELVRSPYDEAFSAGTVAIQVGKEIWLGSVRGDRIAVYPATQQLSR
jgi:hypothetical protein